jgi:hypothetical protein
VTSTHKTVIPERLPLISVKVNIDPADISLFLYKEIYVTKGEKKLITSRMKISGISFEIYFPAVS